MQERSIRMRTLTFEVGQEPASQLSWERNTHNRGISNRLAGSQRQLAPDLRDRTITRSSAFGKRVLESDEEVASNDRRSLNRTVHANPRNGHVNQPNAADW